MEIQQQANHSKSNMSPTQRSLKQLRDDGWSACVVERWIQAIKQRKDAFGFGDILAVKIGIGIMLVQSTTAANASARVNKIRETVEAGIWLAAGGRLVVHGWSKKGGKGKRKLWQCAEYTLGIPCEECRLIKG